MLRKAASGLVGDDDFGPKTHKDDFDLEYEA
jgi:hypothetical protein